MPSARMSGGDINFSLSDILCLNIFSFKDIFRSPRAATLMASPYDRVNGSLLMPRSLLPHYYRCIRLPLFPRADMILILRYNMLHAPGRALRDARATRRASADCFSSDIIDIILFIASPGRLPDLFDVLEDIYLFDAASREVLSHHF